MCLILLGWRAHADFPLVIAANRDEFYARPAAPAQFWKDAPQVLAGIDLEAGGTWLGMTRNGRFAALTNYRDPAQMTMGRPSRGKLVADYLAGSLAPEAYLASVEIYGARCNGYNLLVGELGDPANGTAGELWWSSNVSGEARRLAPGIYGLSNHLLDTDWPKVSRGRTALDAALSALPQETALRELLVDAQIHPDAHLPSTGIPLEWERALSAAFIRTPGYGTRASTIVTVDSTGKTSFDEQTWLQGSNPVGHRHRYRFTLNT